MSDVEWETLAAAVPAPVPTSLLALYRWRNGQASDSPQLFGMPEIGDCGWSWMSVERILAARDAMNELLDVDQFDAEVFPSWWNRAWVPILEGPTGDHWCVDAVGCFGGEPGQVILFDHETDRRDVLFPSISVWLDLFVRSLHAGAWHVDEVSGLWVPCGDMPFPEGFPRGASAGDL